MPTTSFSTLDFIKDGDTVNSLNVQNLQSTDISTQNMEIDSVTCLPPTTVLDVVDDTKFNKTILGLKNLRIGTVAGTGEKIGHTDLTLMGDIETDTGSGEILMSSSGTSSKLYMGRISSGNVGVNQTISEINTYVAENDNYSGDARVVASIKVKATGGQTTNLTESGMSIQFFTQTLRNNDDLSLLSNFNNPALTIFRNEDNGRAVLDVDGAVNTLDERMFTISSTSSGANINLNSWVDYRLLRINLPSTDTGSVTVNLPTNSGEGTYYRGKTLTIKRQAQDSNAKTIIQTSPGSTQYIDDVPGRKIELGSDNTMVTLFFHHSSNWANIIGGIGYTIV